MSKIKSFSSMCLREKRLWRCRVLHQDNNRSCVIPRVHYSLTVWSFALLLCTSVVRDTSVDLIQYKTRDIYHLRYRAMCKISARCNRAVENASECVYCSEGYGNCTRGIPEDFITSGRRPRLVNSEGFLTCNYDATRGNKCTEGVLKREVSRSKWVYRSVVKGDKLIVTAPL